MNASGSATASWPIETRKTAAMIASDPAALLDQRANALGIGLNELVHEPQDDQERDDAEENGGHHDLICARSLIAPASRRADRSSSAFMPPAA